MDLKLELGEKEYELTSAQDEIRELRLQIDQAQAELRCRSLCVSLCVSLSISLSLSPSLSLHTHARTHTHTLKNTHTH